MNFLKLTYVLYPLSLLNLKAFIFLKQNALTIDPNIKTPNMPVIPYELKFKKGYTVLNTPRIYCGSH